MTTPITLPKTPSLRLDGKRALVTGAGRGIGLACAAALAEAGAHVTLAARTTKELDAAATAIRKAHGQADAVTLDVTDLDAVHAAMSTRPAFDVFVNNAGTNRPKFFTDVTVDDYDTVMDLNVRAAFFMAQAVARRMIAEAKHGSIINISSTMGHVGGAKRTVYCASKFAVEGLTKAMALDLAPHRIRVNAISPTLIETPMTAPLMNDAAFMANATSKIKLGRVGRTEDLMGAVLYLACDVSALVTGTSLLVDGGWTAE